jgi:hypothetical protein
VLPTFIVALFGFTEIDTEVASTVSVAALLVASPAELLTTTVNCDPLSDAASAGVV